MSLFKREKTFSVIDAGALKTILELQRQNVEMERAIEDAAFMLITREKHLTLKRENQSKAVEELFKRIYIILGELEKPSDKSKNTNNGTD